MSLNPKERAVLAQIAGGFEDLLELQVQMLGDPAEIDAVNRRILGLRGAIDNLSEPVDVDRQKELGQLLDVAASAATDGRRVVMSRALGQLTVRLGKLVVPQFTADVERQPSDG